jgi:uncharacterized repeat protein (TIGR03803 family)
MIRLKHPDTTVKPEQNWVIPLSSLYFLTRILRGIFLIAALIFCLPFIELTAQKKELNNATKGNDSFSFKKLFDFQSATSGSSPTQLLKSGDILYGITSYGGPGSNGILYKIKTDGSEFAAFGLVFYKPHSLTLSDSVLYGSSNATYYEDSYLYRVNVNGTGYRKIYVFGDDDAPRYEIMYAGGMIYGVKYGYWNGTSYLFKIRPDGTGFNKFGSVGDNPYGKLIFSEDYLYGTTDGPFGFDATLLGTVYKIKTDGTGFVELHRFTDVSTGDSQLAPVILVGSTLYGATLYGGLYGSGLIFRINTDGTDFEILHNFTSEDGSSVWSKLVSSGNVIYGAAYYGGIYSYGTLFKMNLDGSGFQKLYDFQGNDGSHPVDMIMSGDTIFGITAGGGLNNDGVIFSYIVDKGTPDIIKTIKLSIKSPVPITLNTKDNMVVESGKSIDLDTTFSVTGNIQYTYTWKVKTSTGYDIINKTAKITSDSTFYLFVTTSQGCSFLDSIVVKVKSATGIKEVEPGDGIYIYPNPNDGNFQINIRSGYGDCSYEIFNISGAKITAGNIYCPADDCIYNIRLTEVKPGAYTLVIRKGNTLLSKQKFIISN